MPQNTQMHMQWITVNGQSVPLVLPQYWDGEKWVISSEQNPLPVKAELTGSNVEYMKMYKETISSDVVFQEMAAGTTESVVVIEEPCVLESLMIATSNNLMQLRVENRRIDGGYQAGMRLLGSDGRFSGPIMPSLLNNLGGENDYWREFVYDTNRNNFAFGMKRSSVFASGLRIRVQNPNGETHSMGVTYLITKYANWE